MTTLGFNMDNGRIKIYLLNSLVLFNKFIPFLLAALSLKLFQIVDSACTYSIGTDVIVALSTFVSLKFFSETFSTAIDKGFVLLLSKQPNKNNLKCKDTSELASTYLWFTEMICVITQIVTFAVLPIQAKLFNISDESYSIMMTLFKYLCLYCLQSYLNAGYEFIFKVQRRQKVIILGLIIQSTINISGDLISVYKGCGVNGIYTTTIIAETTKMIIYLIVSNMKLVKPKLRIIKLLLSVSKDFLIDTLCQRLVIYLQKWFASTISEFAFAVFSLVWNIIDIVVEIVCNSSNDAHLIYTGEYYAYYNTCKENRKYNKLYEVNLFKQTVFYVIFQCIICIIIYTTAGYPLFLIHTKEIPWSSVNYLLVICCIENLCCIAAECFLNILKVYNRVEYTYKSTIMGVIIRILTMFIALIVLKSDNVIYLVLAMLFDWSLRFFYLLIVSYKFQRDNDLTIGN